MADGVGGGARRWPRADVRPADGFATAADFWKVFVPSLTGMVGFWATLSLNIPDFTRFGRGQREQMLGQTLGLPTTMIAFSAMAVVITSAAETVLKGSDPKLWDPVVLLGQITSSTAPRTLTLRSSPVRTCACWWRCSVCSV